MTKLEKVKEHLLSGKSLTGLDALKLFGSYRLAAIIHNLRKKENMNIHTEFITKGEDTFAKYTLVKSE